MKRLNELYKFITKRNGIDELNKILLVIYLMGFITSFFIKNFYLDLSVLIIAIIIIYRFISKNLTRRNKENKIYLKIRDSITGIFKPRKKIKSNDDYIYKKCSKCKTTLRLPLPSKRGIKHTRCPKCNKRLTVLALKKLKVEYIRKGDEK